MAPIYSTYASTEMATLLRNAGSDREGISGRNSTYVEIVDEQGNRLPDGEVGESGGDAAGS